MRQTNAPLASSRCHASAGNFLGGIPVKARSPLTSLHSTNLTQHRRVTRVSTRAESAAVAVSEQAKSEPEASSTAAALPAGVAAVGTSEETTADDPSFKRVWVKAASSTKSTDGTKKVPPSVKSRRAKDWDKARDLLQSGKLYKTKVESLNDGGARVRFGSLVAFLPFSQMESSKVAAGAKKGEGLVGTEVLIQVVEANEAAGRLVVSQLRAIRRMRLSELQVGQVWDGRVNSITDYGAFVDLITPEGRAVGVGGLVHLTELSWDAVANPAAAASVGQQVKVKILRLDREKGRLGLSMKQVESDPLYTTLDTLLTPSTGPALGPGAERALDPLSPQQPIAEELLGAPLPGLQDLRDTLRKQEGILEVTLGRQALERRVVSQDLELWLSNVPVKDGQYTLVARAGRQVQEVFVKATLDREGMKQAVLKVSQAMPYS